MENVPNLPNFQSVLFALSSELSIQYHGSNSKLYYKAAPEEARTLFKIELQKLLDELSKKLHPNSYVCCSYSFGRVRGGLSDYVGSLVESVSPEIQEAMSALPKLEKGERYCFPQATFVCFELTSDRTFQVETQNHSISPWIEAKLSSK